ncbi:ribonuclease P protein subunit p25-like protein [Penaeus japonicus]|uniref:ribonuclease P protein subunit p25-like protein n=1 Tax=Penaeus japonicus TaxID=27405 RepID=UPI001C70C070|nr:ribonuclease P protein subunit p25-like protein [Penaeus japonicus]XP_042871255.1 ribonuclease P protein subunit p25-like protein [Penaeus japonicus]
MENYSKGENVELEMVLRVPGCTEQTMHMTVNPSSKIRGIISAALDKLKTETQLLFIGSGPAVGKAVSCAEITKKRVKNLHQINHLCYKKVLEYWDPKLEGLDRLCVTREIPTIAILLSKEPLDSSVPGYQAPGSTGDDFWKQETHVKRRRNLNSTKDQKNRHHGRHGNASSQPRENQRYHRPRNDKSDKHTSGEQNKKSHES